MNEQLYRKATTFTLVLEEHKDTSWGGDGGGIRGDGYKTFCHEIGVYDSRSDAEAEMRNRFHAHLASGEGDGWEEGVWRTMDPWKRIRYVITTGDCYEPV